MPNKNKNKTKVVITLGPACSNLKILTKILKSGANAVRINASHEPRSSFKGKIRLIRQASTLANKPICILLDLSGPKIRTGNLQNHAPLFLMQGQTITLTPEKIEGTPQEISISYPNLSKVVKKGDPILIDDGRLELKVNAIRKSKVICHIVVGGLLYERKGVNLPGLDVSIQSFTHKDRLDLAEGLKQGIDVVALSFVQTEKSILKVKKYISSKKQTLPVIAKIEKPQAVKNFDSILKVSDGIMIARGDLGIEIPPEQVPMIQKRLIKQANEVGVPIITATQMLESMIQNPRPTRAESSDVANAVLDGSDAVMLSGETAVGKHPVQACRVMSSIIKEVEQEDSFHINYQGEFTTLSPTHSVAHASAHIASNVKATSIIVFTKKGKSALVLSKFRPKARILAITSNKKLIPSLALLWGVVPFYLPQPKSVDLFMREAKKLLKKEGWVKKGENVIFTTASPEISSQQNWIKIDRI